MFRPTTRLYMRATRNLRAVTEQSAGTTSIRFQRLREIPIEAYPLGVIVGFMISYGVYAMAKALTVGDPTLRNHRQVNNNKTWEEKE